MAKSKLFAWCFITSAILILLGFLWAYLALKDIPQPLILHFGKEEGITDTGSAAGLLGIAVIGWVMVAMNFVVARELERRGFFWSKVVAHATLFLSLLIFIAFWVIVRVN